MNGIVQMSKEKFDTVSELLSTHSHASDEAQKAKLVEELVEVLKRYASDGKAARKAKDIKYRQVPLPHPSPPPHNAHTLARRRFRPPPRRSNGGSLSRAAAHG